MPTRMARYDVRNDGLGPYATFYCDRCSREYRSQPDVKATVGNEIGRSVMGGFLRNIPFVGSTVARNIDNQDPRYVHALDQQQVESAWDQVKDNFHDCPTCHQIVCGSDWDAQAGTCADDSPRKAEIAQAQAEQAAGVVKGLASAFGIGDAIRSATDAAKRASASVAHCPNDGTVARAGTKFCPECGTAMIQPVVETCPNCGAATAGAKFCPGCGSKVEQPEAVAAICPSCGTDAQGAKFCPNCGTRIV